MRQAASAGQCFAGDHKKGRPLVDRFERWLVPKLVPLVPRRIETYHLTLLTLPWSLGVIIFGYLAQSNFHWLWLVSVMVILQYITDLLDGAVGRARGTGLVRWGYYMDHFLDYVFLCSILIGYYFIVPMDFNIMLFFILAIIGGYMIHAYLAFAITNEFRITHMRIGPSELRLLFISINTLLIFFGKTYLSRALPFVLIFLLLGLAVLVRHASHRIWQIDQQHKNQPR